MTNVCSWQNRQIIFDEIDIKDGSYIIKGTHWGDVILSRYEEDVCSMNNKSRTRRHMYATPRRWQPQPISRGSK